MRMAREEEKERNDQGRWRPPGLEGPSGLFVGPGRPPSRTTGEGPGGRVGAAAWHQLPPTTAVPALPPSHRLFHLLPFSLHSLKGWLAEDVAA